MIVLHRPTKSMFIAMVMLLSTTLAPGCLDGSLVQDTEGEDALPSLPQEAMGLWLPTVDGHLQQQAGRLYGEWMDSHAVNIEFTSQKAEAAKATLRVKAVDHALAVALESNDFVVSPSKIILKMNDRTLVSQVEESPREPTHRWIAT